MPKSFACYATLGGALLVTVSALLTGCSGGTLPDDPFGTPTPFTTPTPTPSTTPTPAPTTGIFVADRTQGRVTRIADIAGTGRIDYGLPGSGTGQFNTPRGVTLDSSGRVYVADSLNQRVVRVNDVSGTGFVAYGSLGTGTGQFSTPVGVAVDADGRIYVADIGNNRIVRMDDLSGTNFTAYGPLGTSGTQSFGGVAVDTNKRIYAIDSVGGRIVRIDNMTGANLVNLDVYAAAPTGSEIVVRQLSGVAVGSDGKIYTCDRSGGRVVRFDDMTGANPQVLSTSPDGLGHLNSPSGIAFDASGHLYICDTGNARVIRVDDISGANWATFGGGAYGIPEGIAVK